MLLSLLMIITVIPVGMIDALATTTVTSANSPSCTFYVPETIYLNPSDGTTFQYYVDRDSSGNLVASANDTTGNIYFNCSSASAVTSLTCNGATVSLSSTSSSSGTLSANITSGSISSALSSGSTSQISWTLTYTVNGKNYIAKAYSTLYSPNRNVTACGVFGYDYNSSESCASSLIYIYGAHKTYDGARTVQAACCSADVINYQNVSTSSKYLDPLVNGVANPDSDGNAPNSWTTSDSPFTNATKSFTACRCAKENKYDGNTNWVMQVDYNTSSAELYVDSSRYTNTNQLPNLGLGFIVTDWDNSNSRRNYYVSDATSAVTYDSDGTPHLYSSSNSIDITHHYYCKNDDKSKDIYGSAYGTVLSGTTSSGSEVTGTNIDGSTNDEGQKYKAAISCDITANSTSTQTRFYRGACTGNKNKSWAMSSAMVSMKVICVNKSDLRTNVNTCIGTYNHLFYTAASYGKYSKALAAAALVLGNPAATATEISNANTALTTAKDALVRITGTATETITFTSGKATQTSTKTYNAGDTVSTTDPSITGYQKKSFTSTTNLISIEDFYNFQNAGGSYVNRTGNTITSVTLSNGALSVTGSGNDNYTTMPPMNDVTYCLDTHYCVPVTPGKTYTLSYTATGTSAQGFIFPVDENGISLNACTSSYATGNTSCSYTVPSNVRYVAFRFGNGTANSTTVFTNISFTENGATTNATSYTLAQGDTAFNYVYEPITYNITYNLNGGTVATANPTTYNIETNTFTLNNPTRAGYNFTGWTGSNGSTASTSVSIANGSTGDKTYTANWEIANSEVMYDNLFSLVGWFRDSSSPSGLTTSFDESNRKLTCVSTDDWKAATNDSYYVEVSPNTDYVFSFDYTLNGTATSAYVYAGNEDGKAGSTFADVPKYYYNGSENKCASGIYSKTSSTLLQQDTNGNYTVWPSSSTDVNRVHLVYTYSNSSNTFRLEFKTGSDCTRIYFDFGVADNDHVGCTVDYYNTRLIEKNSIYYNSINYSASGKSYLYDSSALGTLITPTRTGYTFGGWNTSKDGTGTSVTSSTAKFANPTKLWSQWTPTNYTITYTLNDGTVATANPTSYNIETATFTLNNPTKTGHTFNGWTGSNGTTASTSVSIAKGSTGNKSYTANWTANTYTVTLNTNGGTISSGNVTGYTYGVGATLPTNITKTGYTFGGWFNNSGCAGTAVTSITTTDLGNKTYYAKWTPTSYTITYNLDDGTVATANPTSYTIETATFTLNNPTKTGHTFNGWTGSNGTTAQTTVSIAQGSTGNKTYTANWTANTYNVTLNTNGGTINAGNVTGYTYGVGATLPTNITKTGYTFGGWFDNSDCTGTAVTSITTTDLGDKTYYAKWTIASYTITFKNGTTTVGTDTPNYNVKPVYSGSTPTKASDSSNHYTFDGWTVNSDGSGTVYTASTLPVATANATYYAHFSSASHSFGDWTTDTNPGCTTTGTKHRTCSACSYVENGSIAATGHSGKEIAAKDANCTETGNYKYYQCENCKLYFTDSACTNSTTVAAQTIPALGHAPQEIAAKSPTCTETGNNKYYKCSRCDACFTDSACTNSTTVAAQTISDLGHDFTDNTSIKDNGDGTHSWKCIRCSEYGNTASCQYPSTWTTTKEATCTEKGEKQRSCTVCGHTVKSEVSKKAHTMTRTVAKAKTCTTAGNKEYFTCSVCNGVFADIYGNTATTVEASIIPATGHSYGAPVFNWNNYLCATATFTCETCNHTEDASVTVTPNTTPATCETDGQTVYTAKCTFDDDEYTDTKTQVLTKLGHNYGNWTYNASTKQHEKVCANDASHVIKENCSFTSVVTTKASCVADGVRTYTCSVCSGQYTETIAKRNHNWTEYTQTLAANCTTAGSKIRYCQNTTATDEYTACSASETATIPALGHDEIPHTAQTVTCTDIGWDAYVTCSRCDYTTYVEIPALGHDYGTVTCTDISTCKRCGYSSGVAVGHDWEYSFTWTGTTACSCTRTCKRDSSHTESVNCTITPSTVPATCETAGKSTYTAKATFTDAEKTDVKTVTLPATGHDYTGAYKDNSDGTHSRLCKNGCGTYGIGTSKNATEACTYGTPTYTWTGFTSCTVKFVCTACSHEETAGGVISHSTTTKAECEKTGVETYVAKFTFGGKEYTDTKTDTIPATGHDYTGAYKDNGNGTHSRLCKNGCGTYGIGTTKNDSQACTYGEPTYTWNGFSTCTAKFVCTLCSHEATTDGVITHSTTTEAECEKTGVETYVAKFTFGGKEYTDTKTDVIPVTGHNYTGEYKDNGDGTHSRLCVNGCNTYGIGTTKNDTQACTYGEPTYTWNGFTSCTAKFTCTLCSHEATADGVITHSTTTEAECENTGVETYVAKFTFGGKDYTDTKTDVIPATGHDYTGDAHKVSDGKHNYACVNGCGTYGIDKTKNATEDCAWNEPTFVWDEDFGAVANFECTVCGGTHTDTCTVTSEDTTPATCENTGVRTYTATSTFSDTYTDTKTMELVALGHDLINHEAKAPTCEDHGWEAYVTCSRCDYSTYKSIKALDHDFGDYNWINNGNGTHSIQCLRDASHYFTVECEYDVEYTVEPSCTTPGTAVYTCKFCGYSYEESVTPKHDLYYVTKIEPTEDDYGYKAHYACHNCDAVFYDSEGKEPTTMDELRIDKVDCLHVYGTYSEITRTAGCSEPGVRTYYCSKCNAVVGTESIPAVGHSLLVVHPAVEPTCTTVGHIEYWTCPDCGDVFVATDYDSKGNPISFTESTLEDVAEPVLGHFDNDGDGYCDDCDGQITNGGATVVDKNTWRCDKCDWADANKGNGVGGFFITIYHAIYHMFANIRFLISGK